MAKKRTSTALARYTPASSPRPQVISITAPSPVRRRSSSTSLARRKAPKKQGRRRGKAPQKSMGRTLAGVALASGLIGLAEKSGILNAIPHVPLVGTKGAVALGAWAFHHFMGGGEITKDIAVAATALATYQLGKEGQITGDYLGNR